MNLLANNIINSKAAWRNAEQYSDWTKTITGKNDIVALTALLHSRNSAQARLAEEELVKIGVRAVPYLILALDNEYNQDNPISNTLVKIGAPATDYLLKELKASGYRSERIPEILIKINPYKPEVIKALILSYDCYENDKNMEIINILANGGIKTLPYLKSALKSANGNARICASAAIECMDRPITKIIIKDIETAMGDKNDKVAENAADALMKLGRSALSYALENRKNMKNDNTRLGAYKILFSVLGQDSHKYAMEALNDANPKIRAEAVWELNLICESHGYLPTKGIVDILIEKARDNDKEVRKAAVWFLNDITDWPEAKKAIKVLTVTVFSEQDKEIQGLAGAALRAIKRKR